ncbi:MAG: CDP-archaeol synthase [Stellaceae bacterium]
MHLSLTIRLVFLVLLANGTPLVAGKLLGPHLVRPLDSGREFVDGRPLFGQSKTVRGLVLAILITTAAAPLVGLSWRIGMLVGLLAMSGDLFSSFLKRRLGRSSSSPAIGLDQIPESLFPLLGCLDPLSLTVADVVFGVTVFVIGEFLVSCVLYAFDWRERPY